MQEAFFFLTHLARNIMGSFMGLLQKNIWAAALNILWQQCLWHFYAATPAKAAVCLSGGLGSDIASS